MVITQEYIRNLCNSTRTFEKGRNYYFESRVVSLIYSGNNAHAKVQGTYLYDVYLTFNSNGQLTQHSCTCAAHSTYSGICKHIVAVLFKMMFEHKSIGNDIVKPIQKIQRDILITCPDCGCVFDEKLGKCPECACPVSYIKGVK